MAQMHSYYITNAMSELKFSCDKLSELEATMQEITAAMIDNDELFDEEYDDIFSDSESIDLDEVDTNNLLLADIINLDISEFDDSNDSNEKNKEVNVVLDRQQNNEDPNDVNFEALLAEEFGV
jgi:hypothetical protein